MDKNLEERCTGYLFFVVCVSAFGGFLYGFNTAIISGALIFLTSSFQLSINQQGEVVSVLLIGALIGALIAGVLADRIGRRRTIAITSSLFIIGGIILGLAESYDILLLGRFVCGIGVGVISLAAPMYLAEISPPRYRGSFVSLYQLAITLGILCSFVVNYWFAYSGEWRWMFAFGIFPAILQMLALFFLPETPAWLFRNGFDDLAVSTLEKLRKDSGWRKQLEAMKASASHHKRGAWSALFSPKLRFVLLIGFCLSSFQQITGINTVIYYAPKIFQTSGINSVTMAILATMGIGIINVFATLFSVWLIDKMGRRMLLLIGSAGMALSLGLLTLAYLTHSSMIDRIAIYSLMAYVAFFAIGLGPVTWVVISEIYPLKVRGKAMTIATFANWVFNYLVSLTFLNLITSIGSGGTFLLYTVICLLCIWFIYRYIPETKGKSLEEIEAHLTQK